MVDMEDENQLRMILQSYLEPERVEECVRQLLRLHILTPRARAAVARVEQLREGNLNATTEQLVIAALSGAADYDHKVASERDAAEFDEWAGGLLPIPPPGLLGMVYRELGMLANICSRALRDTPLTPPEKSDVRRHRVTTEELRSTLEQYIIPSGAVRPENYDQS